MEKKVVFYSLNAISLASFVGTPLAGCILGARNFWAVGYRGRAYLSICAGLMTTALIVVMGKLFPISLDSGFPFVLFSVIYASATRFAFTLAQKEIFENAGYLKYPRWKTFYVSLLTVSFSLVVFLGIGFLAMDSDERDALQNIVRIENCNSNYRISIIATSTIEEAQAALALLQKGKKFKRVARDFSIGPNATTGGSIGCVTPSDFGEDVEQALIGLSKGQFTMILKVDNRYAIIRRN